MELKRRRRLNWRLRTKLYESLVKIKGKKCWECGTRRKPLEVDDVDNDGDYKTPGKQQLLCHRCNIRKNPRGKGRFNPKRSPTVDEVEPQRTVSAEYQTNRKAEPCFLAWLGDLVSERGSVSVRDAKNAGAEYVSQHAVSISQQTISRYIDKATSFHGRFIIDDSDEKEAMIRIRGSKASDAEPDLLPINVKRMSA